MVIAIISILAGMLLPALQRARLSAQAVTCVNNQKQAGLAFMLYSQDSDGIMALSISTPSNSRFWLRFLTGKTSTSGTLWASGTFPKYLDTASIAVCPNATPFAVTPDYNQNNIYGALAWTGTSTATVAHANEPGYGRILQDVGTGTGYLYFIRPSKAKNPSRCVVIVDTIRKNGTSGAWEQLYTVKQSSTTVGDYLTHLRHNNRANALSADGHVNANGFKGDLFFNKLEATSYYNETFGLMQYTP